MLADKKPDAMNQFRQRAMDVECTWCGAVVPLPTGDSSGVCIDCGTVIFRDEALSGTAAQAGFEHCINSMEDLIRNQIGRSIPAPAS